MPYELFLALRYLRSRRKRRLARATSVVAILGIGIGVSTLIVALKRLTETIYELRPATDTTATDAPYLKRLLPENRLEDTKKCPPGRA